MKTKCLSFFLVLLGMFIHSQQFSSKKEIDSLANILKTSKSDSTKARIAFLLSDFWSYQDSTKSKHYLHLGNNLTKKNTYLKAVSHFYTGGYLFDKNPDQASQEYLTSEKIFAQFTNQEAFTFRARAWRNYGALLQRKNKEKEMLKIVLEKAIPLAEKAKDYNLLGGYYTDIGLNMMNQLLYQQAEDYLGKAEDILAKNKGKLDKILVAKIYRARNFAYLGETSKSKKLIDEIDHLLQGFPVSEFNLDNYVNKSIYYRKTNQNTQAIQVLKEGISLSEQLHNQIQKSSLEFQLYKVYNDLKQYENALKTLKTVIEESETSYLNEKAMYYYEIATTYENLQDYKNGYVWMKKFAGLQDSMAADQLKSKMAEMEIQYQSSLKEKQISKLEAEKQENALKQKNQVLINWLLGLGLASLLIVFLLGIQIYRNSKKQNAQKIHEIQQQKNIEIGQALIEGEEKERQRIARDLHDGLGGELTGIKMKLSSYQTQENAHFISEIIQKLEKSLVGLRKISQNMMPETLLRSGLETALKDLRADYSSIGIDIELQMDGLQKKLPLKYQINIYRIIQELLNNAVKHGKASHIIIQCLQNQNKILITVEDNGIGFESDSLQKFEGSGFKNIKNRVDFMSGTLDIDSISEQGTTINIEINV